MLTIAMSFFIVFTSCARRRWAAGKPQALTLPLLFPYGMCKTYTNKCYWFVKWGMFWSSWLSGTSGGNLQMLT